MKRIFRIPLLLLSLFSISIDSQEKIYRRKEIGKIQSNQSKYAGKKVKFLIDDLKVEVKSVQLEEGYAVPSIITLRFNEKNEYNRLRNKTPSEKPSKIMIFINENSIETKKLFQRKDKDSTSYIIENTSSLKNNVLLKDYLEFTIMKIIAVSER